MELRNKKLTHDEFMTERQQVLKTWETGKDVENFEDGVKYQQTIPEHKRFSLALLKADKEGKTLSQPRAGVALMDEHIELLKNTTRRVRSAAKHHRCIYPSESVRRSGCRD